MTDTYDRNGNPISMDEWAENFGDFESRNVLQSDVQPPTVHVSTVHLGLDHQWGDGPPLIFESLITGGLDDQYIERYATEEEAKAGHARLVDLIERGVRIATWEDS